jgi:hypothetical protein
MDFICPQAPLPIESLWLWGLSMCSAVCDPHTADSLLTLEHRHA